MSQVIAMMPKKPSAMAPAIAPAPIAGGAGPSAAMSTADIAVTPKNTHRSLVAIGTACAPRVATLDVAKARPAVSAYQSARPSGHGAPSAGFQSMMSAPSMAMPRLAAASGV